ncbi:MAG: L,D-transpeptidase family protein [Clostridia bacterium]|nr:L,D-transpeptidase family protein [Clostridia bacterium]
MIAVILAAVFVSAAVSSCGSDNEKLNTLPSEPFGESSTAGELSDSDLLNASTESVNAVSESSLQTSAQPSTQTTAKKSTDYVAWGYIHTASGGNANVRAKSSADSEIIGSTKSERLVRIYGRSSDKKWYKIKVNKKYGFVSAVNVMVADYAIAVYKGNQRVAVYKNGDLSEVKIFQCSTGRAGHETPTKDFYITTTIKGRVKNYTWRDLKGNVFGQYGTTISPYYLFHSLPYKTKGKNASMDKSGYQALLDGKADSDGCIRLCVRDAKWIFENCDKYTTVRIVDEKCDKEPTENYPALKKGKNADGVSYSGWDPTDPDENNPYNAE